MATRQVADAKSSSARTARHQPCNSSSLDGNAAAQQLLGWMHQRMRVASPQEQQAVATRRGVVAAAASVTAACKGRGKAQAPAGAPAAKQRGSVLLAPIHVLAGGARGMLWVAGLPLGLLLGRRHKADPAAAPGLPARTKEERERQFLAERRRYAAEECRGLFLLRGLERQRTAEFFKTFASDKWRLEEDRSDGTEVWRLPGARIHTIMGIHTVNAAPKTALDMFSDPKAVFTRVFPRVDTMFIAGQVLETKTGGETLCAAIFKLPNLVGPGSAPGFPPREMVWRQFVTKLQATGNVLVTAATGGENAAHKAVIHRGAVRGTLLTSGYYGRKLPGSRTRVFYVASADPGGIIPPWLVNFAAGRQAGNVTRLAELFKTGRFL